MVVTRSSTAVTALSYGEAYIIEKIVGPAFGPRDNGCPYMPTDKCWGECDPCTYFHIKDKVLAADAVLLAWVEAEIIGHTTEDGQHRFLAKAYNTWERYPYNLKQQLTPNDIRWWL